MGALVLWFTKGSFQLSNHIRVVKNTRSLWGGGGSLQLEQELGSRGFALYIFCSCKPSGWISLRTVTPTDRR